MTIGTPFTRLVAATLAGCALALAAAAPSAAATTTAKLRVLTPDRVLDPGTTYFVDDDVTVPTRPDADCLGPPGGSGAEFTFEQPVALSLLATAGRTTRSVRPLSVTDQFGFGLLVCGIGGARAVSGESFWLLRSNHAEATVGADQLRISNGDEVLFYLAPDNFPAPSPAELELKAPARAKPGEPFTVEVVEHACTTDQTTFETTCEGRPAVGVTVSGGAAPATTGADGTAQVSATGKRAKLTATRGGDIPSETLRVCLAEDLGECPKAHGERIVGSPEGDRIRATKGADVIRARGGNDRIDLRRGGPDKVDCGPGRDVVRKRRGDRDDRIARNCERVIGRR